MIGYIKGILLIRRPPELLIDVSGIGYELQAPMSTFYTLPSVGESVSLFTHLQVREDAHLLYGFSDETQRALFRQLLKVTGIGAKIALAILSGMDAEGFKKCVEFEDVSALIRIPGVGRKIAERLVIEMRDRVDHLPKAALSTSITPARKIDPATEATEALIALGYKAPEASRMVQAVTSPEHGSEQLIRLALQASLK